MQIMTTETYAKEVYCNYVRNANGSCSQQYIRRLVKAGKELPHVKKIERSGKGDKYILLHVDI